MKGGSEPLYHLLGWSEQEERYQLRDNGADLGDSWTSGVRSIGWSGVGDGAGNSTVLFDTGDRWGDLVACKFWDGWGSFQLKYSCNAVDVVEGIQLRSKQGYVREGNQIGPRSRGRSSHGPNVQPDIRAHIR